MNPLLNQFQRTERAPINPADKCTVVSIYPKKLVFRKPTVVPGLFQIEAGSRKEPAILTVGSSSWWRSVGEDQPLLEIPTGALQVAKAIVEDYMNGLDCCDLNTRKPGLFFVPGEIDAQVLKVTFKAKLDEAEVYQNNWYTELIKKADIMWSRTNGNPVSISDDARLAAEKLGQKSKPWLQDFSTTSVTNCPACGHMRNNSFPVCANCKTVIDKVAYEKLNLATMG